jgi:hypothetical protein
VVGWHVAEKTDRWAALEPISRGVKRHFRGYALKIALGLNLRHDWGRSTQSMSSNVKLRDESRDGEILYSLAEAIGLVEQWRRQYNTTEVGSPWRQRRPNPQRRS